MKEISKKNKNGQWPDEIREDIVKRYLLEEKPKEIALAYGIKVDKIYRAIQTKWFENIRNQVITIGIRDFKKQKENKQIPQYKVIFDNPQESIWKDMISQPGR